MSKEDKLYEQYLQIRYIIDNENIPSWIAVICYADYGFHIKGLVSGSTIKALMEHGYIVRLNEDELRIFK